MATMWLAKCTLGLWVKCISSWYKNYYSIRILSSKFYYSETVLHSTFNSNRTMGVPCRSMHNCDWRSSLMVYCFKQLHNRANRRVSSNKSIMMGKCQCDKRAHTPPRWQSRGVTGITNAMQPSWTIASFPSSPFLQRGRKAQHFCQATPYCVNTSLPAYRSLPWQTMLHKFCSPDTPTYSECGGGYFTPLCKMMPWTSDSCLIFSPILSPLPP